jgi:hypothetical protein
MKPTATPKAPVKVPARKPREYATLPRTYERATIR